MKKTAAVATTLLIAGLGMMGNVQAVDMGNMMNPSKWFGGDKNSGDDRYDDRDYDRGPPPGYGPPPGQGYPPPQGRGYPPAQGQGYYPPPQGRGYPPPQGQGYAPAGAGYGRSAMPQSPEACAARIRELEGRIRQLEAAQPAGAQPPAPPPGAQPYRPTR
ncbi:MAG: hypothetical protein DSZ00_08905 [Gammaproteobacteria bacterium]|nr:MAG: hypothetical protein DSZ00_08905 [Gammaproteobacteria bacterium]RTZ74723.1 MAG: hypothetical protein DSZ02_04675 [Gammaproteobacteria bacterium]